MSLTSLTCRGRWGELCGGSVEGEKVDLGSALPSAGSRWDGGA
jgi:hypothetical protein